MKVSIILITYKHEKYIYDTIEGILNQEVDFEVELIIADDNSPDKTCEVVQSFSEHPKYKWIKYTKHDFNKGPILNFMWAINQCKGKYIAICEGDDYWISNMKLKMQYEFLEKNEDYSTCFTNYRILEENKSQFSFSSLDTLFNKRTVFGLTDIIKSNFIPTLTVMFRRVPNIIPPEFKSVYPGDWPLHILNARNGKIKYIPIDTAVYRKHDGGICSSAKPIENLKKYLLTLSLIQTWFKDSGFSIRASFCIARIIIYKNIFLNYLKNI